MERNTEHFTAYITKYALTEGIRVATVESNEREYPGMVSAVVGINQRAYYHGEGCEWHRTKEGALAKAEKMRAAKISALRKQIERLEKMTFTVEAAKEGV